jgi:hypothetical protein
MSSLLLDEAQERTNFEKQHSQGALQFDSNHAVERPTEPDQKDGKISDDRVADDEDAWWVLMVRKQRSSEQG